MPVVMARAGPDSAATSTTGPGGQRRADQAVAGDADRVVEPEQQRPVIVITMDGSTQPGWPTAVTMTGRTKAAASSAIVATVTDRSIRRAAARSAGARFRR